MMMDDTEFIADWLRWGQASLGQQLLGLVAGDTRELVFSPEIPGLVAGTTRTVTKAWLTVKASETAVDPTENAAWTASGGMLSISSTNVVGRGQILSGSSPEMRFDLTAANTAALSPHQDYHADVQVKMSDGALYTTDRVIFRVTQGITQATS